MARHSGQEVTHAHKALMLVQHALLFLIFLISALEGNVQYIIALSVVFVAAIIIHKELFNFMLIGILVAREQHAYLLLCALAYVIIAGSLLQEQIRESRSLARTFLINHGLLVFAAVLAYI